MSTLSRRQLLATAATPALAAAQSQRKPNIVLILADDLGMGDLGCYGQKLLKTPNIDRLAAEGLRFTDAYAGAMVCAPARCTLMTGYHLGHATVRDNWEVYPEGQFPLAARDVTVATVLKQAGYATGICGKWGLGGPDSASTPNKQGFDLFYGYNCQRHAHRFYTDYLWHNTARVPVPLSKTQHVYTQDLIADQSLRFLRDNARRPFFLFCAWTVPHGPYHVNNVPSIAKYAATGWSDNEKVYAAMVERLDADVGRLMATLKELGLDDNTLVLFASDNGAGGGPGNNARFGSQAGLREVKGTLREGGIRVPMIARWPGKVPAGKTTAYPTAFWDFLPTAAELAGATAPKGIDGVSIVPTLQGKPQPPHPLYWERRAQKRLTQVVRQDNWKAYREDPAQPIELYNLAADRAEQHNVAAANAAIVERLRKIMDTSRTDVTPPVPDPRIWEKYKTDNARQDALFAGR